MIGRTVSHYRIVSRLGSGGMGIVYAGEDNRLGRPVALKFVPEELAKDTHAIDRLRAEARAASALNHANICTIYDIGEDDGRPFIVMELIKGRSLADALASGPLKIRYQVVDIGIQVADALDAAHTRGILHRDIKPGNLFLTDHGQVKVLDFGLAKLVPHTTASNLTAEATVQPLTTQGATVGTVAYMSPEQVTGEQLDGRTDLFSLGVVLYECVTGHRPFTGKTSAVIFSAILNRAPVAPVILNPDVPLRLQEIINNCLEKDRELRCQDAAGVRADLKRLRRDLESLQSEGTRTVSTVPGSGSGHTVSGPGSAATIATAPADPSGAAAPGSGPRPVHSQKAWAWAVVGGVALAAGLSYLVWSRTVVPAPGPSTTQGVTDAVLQGRLELASASLQSRNYRAALAYAEEVLRLVPGNAEGLRIREAAAAVLARLDDAIATANGRLAAGDMNGATEALEAARAIDASAPAVAELSARMVARFRSEAETARAREAQARAPRPSAPRPSTPSEPATPPVPRPAATGETQTAPPASSPGTPPAVSPSPVPPPASTPPPVAVPPSPAPAAAEPAARPPVVTPSPAPPDPPAGARVADPSQPQPADDDAAIRRVIETYRRAIETQDVALFRSAKPNLSAEEQRRIEEGFRAVSSQRVEISILSIVVDGAEASVRLRRRDTFSAGGRQQSNDSQQTVTLVRTRSGWVIQEIA